MWIEHGGCYESWQMEEADKGRTMISGVNG